MRVYERRDRRTIYVATWDHHADGGWGREVKRSLNHRDRERAKDYADDLAGMLRRGDDELRAVGEGSTVRRIFRSYLRNRTPDKGSRSRRADERHAALWTQVLGHDFNLSKLSRREWDRFLRERASGAIGARGNPVPRLERKPVGDRVPQKDCAWLRAVCRWATEYRGDEDHLLLDRDPTRGLKMPVEKNPARPVASHDRVDAIRAVYRDVGMHWAGRTVESYLPEVFEITVGTGRRISAVCSLRVGDLNLERTERAPWGAIVWPEDTDKMERRWRCPISAPVGAAFEAAQAKRARLGRMGSGPLFPRARDTDEPVRYHEAATWLRSAERKAGLPPQEGSLWHAYRRLWASSRKNLPDVDVAQAGGWASLEALKAAYQQPDDETMLRVVMHETELREAR